MPTPIDASTVYDDTHTWQNVQDRVSAERVLLRSPEEEQLMSQALACADRSMPEDVIRANMTFMEPPPLYGYEDQRAVPPGIDYVFSSRLPDGHLNDHTPSDFSGTNAGIKSSSVPGLPIW
jgi:hypothetical protein